MSENGTYQAQATWVDGLQFVGRGSSSEASFVLDGSRAHGGSNSGVRPMEALLVSLISCTGMDVISILQKKRQRVSDFRVHAKASRADEHPRRFVRIEIEYVVRGIDIAEVAVERAIELSQEKYCGVTASLNCPVVHSYRIETDEAVS